MTLREVVLAGYRAVFEQREVIFLACLAVPVLGTVAARIGKAGKTDADGKFIASVVVGIGLLALVLEIVAAVIAKSLFDASLMDGDALLLAAPVLCLGGSLFGIRWVFPLNQIASLKTAIDVGVFAVACIGVLWLFSKFRGWGIIFFGSIGQLVTVGVLLIGLLKRLYKRAFGGGDPGTPTAESFRQAL